MYYYCFTTRIDLGCAVLYVALGSELRDSETFVQQQLALSGTCNRGSGNIHILTFVSDVAGSGRIDVQ